jgi:hypothetical protein
MFILVANLVGMAVAWLLSLLELGDAQRALAEGVFSATSVAGYSVGKSVLLYFAYIAVAVVLGVAFSFRKGAGSEAEKTEMENNRLSGFPVLRKKEIALLCSVVIIFVVANYLFSVKFFDAGSMRSEEFYNLAAADELHYQKFDIIYPYSIGNIVFVNLFRAAGLSVMAYKALLNSLALILMYIAIAVFVRGWRRFLYSFLIILFYFQPLISPSLHRNLLRFIIPFLVLTSLYLIHSYLGRKLRFFYLFLLNLLVFLLSSADVLVVSYLVYGLFILLNFLKDRSGKNLLLYMAGPLAALVFLFIIFGQNEFYLLKNQLSAIGYYSGFANTNPYFDVFAIFGSNNIRVLIKNTSNLLIYYLPLFIIFNLFLFFTARIKKISLDLSSPLTYVMILVPAYFVYNRQTLGDAGVGRIGIAAVMLLFITMILAELKNKPAHLRFIYRTSLVFFIAIFSVSLYFLRYSLIDIYNAQIRDTKSASLVLCAETQFAKRLQFAGFIYCDKDFINELSVAKQAVGENRFYVFDDTFALYYLFAARPVVLIPTYSMSRSGQAGIVRKIANNNISYILYPRIGGFFGVPENSLEDSNFMGLIKSLIYEKYTIIKKTPLFFIYQAK